MRHINKPALRIAPRALIAALLTTTVLTGGAASVFVSTTFAAESPAVATATATGAPLPGFAQLVTEVKPAVVNIAVTESIQNAEMQEPPNSPPGFPFNGQDHGRNEKPEGGHALGSGFIIDPSGYIVTNNHVIDHASKVTVTLADGSVYPAVVKGRDPKTDVALLKINADKPLPHVTFGNSDGAREGDWVIAVGNPFGLGGTVTAGIVSAHGRDINAGPYDNFLQIDAPINPGNSGGPLFDQSGKVIGIDTAIYSPTGGSVGIGFAIPSNLASKIVDQLRDHGSVKRGWLGVEMQAISPALAKAMDRPDSDGVVVDQVEPGSPAATADLRQGDVITALNGNAVKAPHDLSLAVAEIGQGSKATLTISRDGKQSEVAVEIGVPPGEKSTAADGDKPDNPVGLGLAQLSNETRSELGLDRSVKGVVVENVTPDSRAAESGLQAGDVIMKVGGDAVTKPSEAASRIHAAEEAKKAAVPLLVMRDGSTYYLALQLLA